MFSRTSSSTVAAIDDTFALVSVRMIVIHITITSLSIIPQLMIALTEQLGTLKILYGNRGNHVKRISTGLETLFLVPVDIAF